MYINIKWGRGPEEFKREGMVDDGMWFTKLYTTKDKNICWKLYTKKIFKSLFLYSVQRRILENDYDEIWEMEWIVKVKVYKEYEPVILHCSTTITV